MYKNKDNIYKHIQIYIYIYEDNLDQVYLVGF